MITNVRAASTALVAASIFGCLPEVDFTPCEVTDRCPVSDAGSDHSETFDVDVIDVALDINADLTELGDRVRADATDLGSEVSSMSDGSDDIECTSLQQRCGGQCVTPSSDALNCGACSRACSIPRGGTAECRASVCFERCPLGTVLRLGACEAPPPPRLLSPSNTSRLSSRRPLLRWELPAGSDGVRVEFCRTRDCSRPMATEEFIGATGTPRADIAHGVGFWRARSLVGSVASTQTSATWQFSAPTRSTAADTFQGIDLDFNGDGYGDLAAWNPSGRVDLHLGGPAGLSAVPGGALRSNRATEASIQHAGDVNGDGYSDLLVAQLGTSSLYLGGPELGFDILGVALSVRDATAVVQATPLGDVNCDGYGDLLTVVAPIGAAPDTFESWIVYGSATLAMPLTRAVSLGAPSPLGSVGAANFNDDACADFAVFRGSAIDIFVGSRVGVDPTPNTSIGFVGARSVRAYVAGDVSGQGLSDLIARYPMPPLPVGTGGTTESLYFRPAWMTPTTPTQNLASLGTGITPIGDIDNDGHADCAARGTGVLRIYRGTAAGYATIPFASLAVSSDASPRPSAHADFNGDGYADLVVTSTAGISIFVGGTTPPTAPGVTLRTESPSIVF